MSDAEAVEVQKKKRGPHRKTRCMFRDAQRRWWIDYYTADGKRRRKLAGNTKDDAEKLLRQLKTDIDEGTYVDTHESPGFSDFCVTFQAVHGQHHASYCDAGGKARMDRLKKFFGNRKLTDITPEMIEQFRLHRLAERDARDKKSPISRAAITREMTMLRAIFSKAVDLKKLARNPADSVKDYQAPERRDRCLSRAEIYRLFRATKSSNSPILRPAFYLALKTGLRKSELLRLKWADIDFGSGQLIVRKSKTAKPRRVVLSRGAEWLLRKMLACVDNPLNAVWVFESPKENGTLGPAGDIKTAWTAALLRAGIEDFHWHDLRHCFASHHIMNGGDVYALSSMLGHSNPTMTLKTYAHLSPAFIVEQRAVMNRRPYEAATSHRHRIETKPQIAPQVPSVTA